MTKSVLYLLPGLLCDEAVWEEQEKALAPFAEVRIPVFRGFDSLRAMAQSVLDDAPPRFSVVGHSMGGRVAFELMRLAGNRIDKFAVMDTGVHPVSPGEPEKRAQLLAMAEQDGLSAVAREWAPPMLHPARRNDVELMQAVTAMILRNKVEDFQGQIRALLGRDDQGPILDTIRQHVLLVCGREDSWSPLSQHEEMQARLRSADLAVVEQAGHMVTMEQPAQVNEVLLTWWNS